LSLPPHLTLQPTASVLFTENSPDKAAILHARKQIMDLINAESGVSAMHENAKNLH
jgi:hypothetical protein